MEAVAGWTSDEGPSARSSGVSGEPDLLAQVAALACRAIGVQTAVVLLRDPPSGGGGLREVARHGLTRRRMRVAVRCPIVVDGDVRGVLAVVGTRRLEPDQLELLGELADLAATSLEERDRRSHAEAIVTAGVDVLARAVDMRDDYTGRHSAHVGDLARKVGERLGMAAGDIAVLEFAARLHDLGKLAVPDTILQKPGPLDEDEWAVMRRHPEWGAEMVSSVPGLEQLGLLVASHHERWDGSGYPDGLAGESIPLASRVISVCDAYEAMVSRRPYRASLSVQSALGELSAGAGSQFDPVVVAAVRAEIDS